MHATLLETYVAELPGYNNTKAAWDAARKKACTALKADFAAIKAALDKLAAVVENGKNSFPALLEAVEICSLGQISERLQQIVGRFRPMV